MKLNETRNLQRELLIQLRSDLIGSKHTLPFTIYSDTTIEDLLKAQPKTIEELVQVKGFPADGKRVRGFGESIIQIFKNPEVINRVLVTVTDDSEIAIKTELKNMDMF